MKYLMLAYTGADDWDAVDPTSPEFLEVCAFYERLTEELTTSGELVLTEGLAHPALTRTVRRRDGGGTTAVDGPYAETKEVLASFAIVDCVSADRALDIAGRITAATGDAIEVRPIMTGDPTDL